MGEGGGVRRKRGLQHVGIGRTRGEGSAWWVLQKDFALPMAARSFLKPSLNKGCGQRGKGRNFRGGEPVIAPSQYV